MKVRHLEVWKFRKWLVWLHYFSKNITFMIHIPHIYPVVTSKYPIKVKSATPAPFQEPRAESQMNWFPYEGSQGPLQHQQCAPQRSSKLLLVDLRHVTFSFLCPTLRCLVLSRAALSTYLTKKEGTSGDQTHRLPCVKQAPYLFNKALMRQWKQGDTNM